MSQNTKNLHLNLSQIDFKEVPNDIAPDLRTPDSIMRDVMKKEMQLAHLLNIPIHVKEESSNTGECLSYFLNNFI